MTTYTELPERAYEKSYYVARVVSRKDGSTLQEGDKVVYQEQGKGYRITQMLIEDGGDWKEGTIHESTTSTLKYRVSLRYV